MPRPTRAPHFSGAKAKVEWAHRHFQTLKNQVENFFTSNPYVVTIKPDIDGRRYSVCLNDPPPIPANEWGLIIGDCVHAARCALDYIAWELAGADPDDKETLFPVFLTPDGFRTRGKNRIRRLRPAAQALVEQLQPYKTSHPPDRCVLAVLHNLDISDKHHLLTVTAAMQSGGNVNIFPFPPTPFTLDVFSGSPLERDAVVAEINFRIAPIPEVDMKGNITPTIAFGQRFGGQDIPTRVLPALETIVRNARQTVEFFATELHIPID